MASPQHAGGNVCRVWVTWCVLVVLSWTFEFCFADSEILKIVVLDCHPVFTSLIILSGCVVKTVIVGLVRELVGTGPGKAVEETWLAYSIP
jgi:hypothetical protein